MLSILFAIYVCCHLSYANENLIIGGKIVPNTYAPAVVQLVPRNYHDFSDDDFCTATWVGPNVLLAAAHCVEHHYYNGLDRTGNIIKPSLIVEKKSIIIDDRTVNISKIVLHHGADLALLITKSKNKDHIPISFEELLVKDPVELIGYGANCNDCIFFTGDEIKRIGTNTIAKLSTLNDLKISPFRKTEDKELALKEQKRLINNKMNWGQILVVGQADYKFFSSDSPYKKANASYGDSGGPLISTASKGVIGVSSRGRKCEDKKRYYSDNPWELETLYGDIMYETLFNAIFDCREEQAGYGYNYSVASYSMIKEALPFFKFAIQEGADIKMINVDKQKYSNADTKNPYFLEY